MSAASPPIARLRRLRRSRRRPAQALASPRRVQISARKTDGAAEGMIERLEDCEGRIEILLLLEDGSHGEATLCDDGVNSLELQAGEIVFVLPPQSAAS
jgi:hypothetical protein